MHGSRNSNSMSMLGLNPTKKKQNMQYKHIKHYIAYYIFKIEQGD